LRDRGLEKVADALIAAANERGGPIM